MFHQLYSGCDYYTERGIEYVCDEITCKVYYDGDCGTLHVYEEDDQTWTSANRLPLAYSQSLCESIYQYNEHTDILWPGIKLLRTGLVKHMGLYEGKGENEDTEISDADDDDSDVNDDYVEE